MLTNRRAVGARATRVAHPALTAPSRLNCAARRELRVRASLTETIADVAVQGSIIAAVGAVTLTAASLVDTRSERVLKKLEAPKSQDEEGDNIKWAVICAISFVPLINWTVR